MDLLSPSPPGLLFLWKAAWRDRLRSRRGVTLLELILYLLIAGLAVQGVLLPARQQADAIVVNAAREELVAFLHRARMDARVRGEAVVIVYEGEDPVLLLAGTNRTFQVPLTERGVEVSVAGDRSSVELAYGPLGVARFSPATLILRRGSQEAELVISGYGRVSR